MSQNKQDDHELVHQYIQGHEPALEVLINRHKAAVYKYIFYLVRDKALAEDIFQDTFFKVVSKLRKGEYQFNGKFGSWVISIAKNKCMDMFRENKKMQLVSKVKNKKGEYTDIFSVGKVRTAMSDESQVSNQDKEESMKEIRTELKKLINRLPKEQREVLMMRHYYDMSFQEISERMNVNVNTSLGRMRYALISLRKFIDEKKGQLKLKEFLYEE